MKKQLLSTNATRSHTGSLLIMDLIRRPPNLLKNGVSFQCFGGIQNMDFKFSNAFTMTRRYSTRHTKPSSRKLPNLYDVLKVSPKANSSEIKSAFYNLSKTYHPDVNQSEEAVAKFAEILSAYEILGNQTKRRMYDRGTMTHPRFGVSPGKEAHDREDRHRHRHHRNPTSTADFGHRTEGSGPGHDFKSAAGRPAYKFQTDFQEYYSTTMENRQFTKKEAEFFMQKHHEDERTRKFRGISSAVFVFLFLAVMSFQTLSSRTISTSPNDKKNKEK